MSLVNSIIRKANEIAEAEKSLADARQRYLEVKAHGPRGKGYSINVGDVVIPVAVFDPDWGMARIVKGCEMMHLGALKALDGRIDLHTNRLESLKLDLAELGQQLAEKAVES